MPSTTCTSTSSPGCVSCSDLYAALLADSLLSAHHQRESGTRAQGGHRQWQPASVGGRGVDQGACCAARGRRGRRGSTRGAIAAFETRILSGHGAFSKQSTPLSAPSISAATTSPCTTFQSASSIFAEVMSFCAILCLAADATAQSAARRSRSAASPPRTWRR